MHKYMLDTNIVIYATGRRYPWVKAKMASMDREELCISAIVYAEMMFGVTKSKWGEKSLAELRTALEGIEIVPWGEETKDDYGEIRLDLERRGEVIGDNDLLIAAHAKSLGLTLVTHNTREFERVRGLKVEDWVRG